MEEAFFIPLGLSNTHVFVDDTLPEGLARGYFDYDEDGKFEDWTDMNMSYVWSAGCIVSTAQDAAVWMRAMAEGDLISSEFWPDLYQGQSIPNGAVYGAGILVDENSITGHNGTVIGYHADAWHDPSTDTTVAVLSNTNSPLFSDERDPTKEIAAVIEV